MNEAGWVTDLVNENGGLNIPVSHLEELQKKLDRLNRRADKLSLSNMRLSIVEVEPRFWEEKKDEISGRVIWRREYAKCKIEGAAPILDGWQLAAVVEHVTDGANIVRTVPEFSNRLPEMYRTSSRLLCDHCHKAIVRKNTYVVYNVSDNEFKVVGGACLKDFLGHVNPDFILWLASFIHTLHTEASGWSDFGQSYVPTTFDLKYYMGFVVAVVNAQGWVSTAKARESREDDIYGGKTATCWEALIEMRIALGLQNKPYSEYKVIHPTDEEFAKAETIVEWTRAKLANKSLNDFEHNLNVILNRNVVEHQHVAYAAAMSPMYYKEVELPNREPREKKVSNWLGKVGDKFEVEVTIRSARGIENRFSNAPAYIVNMEDNEGNCLCWFTGQEFEEGDKVRIKGTIKNLSEWKGIKQTQVTRCKII